MLQSHANVTGVGQSPEAPSPLQNHAELPAEHQHREQADERKPYKPADAAAKISDLAAGYDTFMDGSPYQRVAEKYSSPSPHSTAFAMAAPRTRNTTVPGSAGFSLASARDPRPSRVAASMPPSALLNWAVTVADSPEREHRYRGGAQAARQLARGPKQELPLRAED